jgi:hypothetical protein
MKGFALILSFLLIACSWGHAYPQDINGYSFGDNRNELPIVPFFRALMEGDLVSLKQYMPEDTYNDYKLLFEQNRGYSNFLKEYYRGAQFHIEQTQIAAGNDVVLDVIIEFPNGARSSVKFVFYQEDTPSYSNIASQSPWKVRTRPGKASDSQGRGPSLKE